MATGCYKGIQLENLLDEILQEIGRTVVEIVRVSNKHRIRKYMPIDPIPGLIINGQLACEHDVPDRKTLYTWLTEPGEASSD